MQLTIERSALLKALGHVQSVVERRNTIPILSNVLLSAGRDRLAFAATDLDMEMVDEAEAQVQVEGQITAPAHTLYEIVRKLPEGAEVSLLYSGDDPRLVVSAGRSRFNLPVLPAGDFPVMSTDSAGAAYVLPKEDLARLIDKTRFAVSTEETRYYLNGLYLHTVAEAGIPLLRAVATDGHRLALAETPAPEGAAGGPGVIVPRKTVDQVRRLLDDAGGAVEVTVSAQKIRFQMGEAALTSKVIDGAFPDYLRVIPRGNDKQADIDNSLFAKAVDRVATISAEKSRSVRMAIEPGGETGLRQRPCEADRAQHGSRPGRGRGRDRLFRRTVRNRLQRPLSAGRRRPDHRRERRLPLRRPGQPDPGARSGRSGRSVCADAAAGVILPHAR